MKPPTSTVHLIIAPTPHPRVAVTEMANHQCIRVLEVKEATVEVAVAAQEEELLLLVVAEAHLAMEATLELRTSPLRREAQPTQRVQTSHLDLSSEQQLKQPCRTLYP